MTREKKQTTNTELHRNVVCGTYGHMEGSHQTQNSTLTNNIHFFAFPVSHADLSNEGPNHIFSSIISSNMFFLRLCFQRCIVAGHVRAAMQCNACACVWCVWCDVWCDARRIGTSEPKWSHTHVIIRAPYNLSLLPVPFIASQFYFFYILFFCFSHEF